MAQAIVTVLILVLFVAYAVFFALWNPGTILVVGFYLSEDLPLVSEPMALSASVPIFVLPLVGLVIGAIVMAIAISTPWSSLKGRVGAVEEQLEAEKERSKEYARRIEALKDRVRKLQAQGQAAPRTSDTGGEPGPGEDV